MAWEQKGFAVVSEARNGDEMLPLVHAFVTTEWEAATKEREVMRLPEGLRVGLQVVPATLRFDLTGRARVSHEQ